MSTPTESSVETTTVQIGRSPEWLKLVYFILNVLPFPTEKTTPVVTSHLKLLDKILTSASEEYLSLVVWQPLQPLFQDCKLLVEWSLQNAVLEREWLTAVVECSTQLPSAIQSSIPCDLVKAFLPIWKMLAHSSSAETEKDLDQQKKRIEATSSQSMSKKLRFD